MLIRLSNGPAKVTAKRLSEEGAINYAPDGRIVGIECISGLKTEHKIAPENLASIIG